MNTASKTAAAEASTEQIDRLFHELELAIRWNRPSILLAVYSSEFVRADVEAALSAKLRALDQSVTPYVVVSEENADIPLHLARHPMKNNTVFFVSGLQWGGGIDGRNAYRALSIRREYFVDYRIRAVFWLTKQEEAVLPNYAPDFWAFRHRVVEFVGDPESARNLPIAREMEWRDLKDVALRDDTEAKIVWREELLNELPNDDAAIVARAEVLYQLAGLYWTKREYSKSLEALQNALKIAERLEDAVKQSAYYNGIGNVYAVQGRANEAIAAYQQAIELDAKWPVPYNNLGNLHRARGHGEDAMAAFERAADLNKIRHVSETSRIFISHAWENKALVRRLEAELMASGAEIWVDHLGIRGGDNLPARVGQALEWCNTFLLIWSEASKRSRWVELEWTNAVALEKRIIPCLLDAVSLPRILANIQYLDFHNFDQGVTELLKVLNLVSPSVTPTAGFISDATRGSGKEVPHAAQPESSPTLTKITLRSKPLSDLAVGEIEKMLKEKGFLDVQRNKQGKGLCHQYEMIERHKKKLVRDHSTGLIWQQSGSEGYLNYNEAEAYIKALNRENFGGYNDWRLPTLEEAMSLMEAKKNSELYLNPIFNHTQKWIWTADKRSPAAVWVVYFIFGYCDLGLFDLNFSVRAVR